MLDVIPSKRLVVLALIVAALALAVASVSGAGLIDPGGANVLAISFALANLAVGVAGLRTPQRIAWCAHLLVSVAVFFLLGFATPVGAIVILTPIAIESALAFIRAA